eukprot:SAG22_NODE_17190_length_310_cov_0.654028_2_plen_32_part_01
MTSGSWGRGGEEQEQGDKDAVEASSRHGAEAE